MNSGRPTLQLLVGAVWIAACAACQSPNLEEAGVIGADEREEQAPPVESPATDAAALEEASEPLVALDEAATEERRRQGAPAAVSAADFLRQASLIAAAEEKALREERERLFAQLLEADAAGETSAAVGGAAPETSAIDAVPTRPSEERPQEFDDIDLAGARERLAAAAARAGLDGAVAAEAPTSSARDAPLAAASAALRSGDGSGDAEPPPAAKPAPPPGAQDEAAAVSEASPPIQRPQGHEQIVSLHQKTADEVLLFIRESFPEWLEKGYIAKVPTKGRSLLVFGEKPDDPITLKVLSMIEQFDFLEVVPTEAVIKPRYVDVKKAMDMLVMRGLAAIWQRTNETKTASWKEGNKTISAVHAHEVYAQTGVAAGQVAPLAPRPKIPYVYEMPSEDRFQLPQSYSGEENDRMTVMFDKTSSTEDRGGFMAVGTEEDIVRIRQFVETIDTPARLIMIEVQVVELDASKFLDLGIDSVHFGKRHTLGSIALPLPGESLVQPGFGSDARRNPDLFVPELTQEGLGLVFDDTSIDLSGRFMGNVHALVREGDATIKARPKLLCLDDRVAVLHIGEEVPTFKSTGVTRDSTNGNLVSEVSQVETQYIGFTLNIRPRVTGGAEDEVALLVEVMVNALGERQRVFEEDLLGIPTVIKRHYIGESRVKNHRPIVLGGLIRETQVESVNKIPLLGDLPLLGYLFRRTQKTEARDEVIFVLTPHILSERGVDRVATPKESPIFDTFDSALFNDNHIVKGRDVQGIDPITGNPAVMDGTPLTPQKVFDLTLLTIIKERELVSRLGILEDYLSGQADDLNWTQKKWPERTLKWWSDKDQEVYFRAAAIVLENIKELNPDLTYEELVLPRREIILPTTPFRISLSYDRVKSLQALGAPLLRGQRVELSEATIATLKQASGKSFRDFAEYLEARGIQAEHHGELIAELKRLYAGLYGNSSQLEGISYPEVYRRLAAVGIDFTALATYLQENLTNRYQVVGPPDVGGFEADVPLFLDASLSLFERARQLQELDQKWSRLGTEDGADEG